MGEKNFGKYAATFGRIVVECANPQKEFFPRFQGF